MRFSTHDPAKLGQKFVDKPELWLKTEDMVRGVLQRSGINYVEVPNEAAFYGPKIDVQVWSAIGREFTIATNQVDFAVPARFGLTYKDRDNTDKHPALHPPRAARHARAFHRLPHRALRRQFPALARARAGPRPPDRRRSAARRIRPRHSAELRAHGVRAELDASSDPIKAKIANAEQMKVHTMLVIGNRDLEAGAVSVRVHGKGNLGAKPRDEVIAGIIRAIAERRP